MDLGITGRVALVLGAGGGLGGAIATALAAEGATVVVADRSREQAQATCDHIDATGGTTHLYTWDLADIEAGIETVDRIIAEVGPVDILVNMTGGPPPSPVAGQDPATWRQNFEMMILSIVTLTDRVLPGMRQRGWGRIITSTTSGVIAPIPDLGLSNALRTSLLGWSKTLAAEVARDGVTSNVVLPGRIATDRIGFLDQKKAERLGVPVDDVVAESLRAIPAGRYGRPEEYGATVAFLAGEQASYITGSVVRVDGGYVPSI
ncbi:SDR family oxidoreductase [Pseudonocardia nematodicida]|uniref:SDR family oxidoreductase n=1 Tax=Pseudonocardia nematodicida TaxID=1206997 RepID=A0ABV1KE72_9PSEU